MAKHVTVFKMQVKPGKVDDLVKIMNDNRAELDRIKAAGWQGTVIGRSRDNPDELWCTVTWDSSENYYKNAQSPGQNESYQRMREMLVADPEWHDADVVDEQFA